MEEKTLFDKEFESYLGKEYVCEGTFTSLLTVLGSWSLIMGLIFIPFNGLISIGSFATGIAISMIHSKIGAIGREKVRKLFANKIIRKYCLEEYEKTKKELEDRYSKRAKRKIKLYNKPGKGCITDSGENKPFGDNAYKSEDTNNYKKNTNPTNSNFTEVITIDNRDFYVHFDSTTIAGVEAEYWWYDDSYGKTEPDPDDPDDYFVNSWKWFAYTLKYPSKEILKELWDSKVGKGE